MDIRGWHKVSLLDYPDKVSTLIFTYGCNRRCPYCVSNDTKITLKNGKTKRADLINVGDILKTPFGKTKVTTYIEDIKELYEIKFKGGKKIKVGKNHLFMSEKNLKKVKNLKIGDIIYGV